MENEIGEYGRTNLGKIIGKFAFLQNQNGVRDNSRIILIKDNKVTNDFYYFENGERIVKHSLNLIDIIEERRLCEWTRSNRNKRMEVFKRWKF